MYYYYYYYLIPPCFGKKYIVRSQLAHNRNGFINSVLSLHRSDNFDITFTDLQCHLISYDDYAIGNGNDEHIKNYGDFDFKKQIFFYVSSVWYSGFNQNWFNDSSPATTRLRLAASDWKRYQYFYLYQTILASSRAWFYLFLE